MASSLRGQKWADVLAEAPDRPFRRGIDIQRAHAFLKQRWSERWAACRGEPGSASVTLETHYVEVADVIVELDGEGAGDDAAAPAA